MTEEERRLLIETAEAVLQCAWWGQNTGIDRKQAATLKASVQTVKLLTRSQPFTEDGL